MSQNRRPSPVQPPVRNTYANSMAHVQQPQGLPTLGHFTGYADSRSPHDYDRRTYHPPLPPQGQIMERLPPIQLPPLNSSTPQPRNGLLSISNLLSRNPDPPKQQRHPAPRPPPLEAPRPPSHSPASGYSTSPNDMGFRLPMYHPAPRHFIDQPPIPPMGPRRSSQPFQSAPHQPAHQYPYPQPQSPWPPQRGGPPQFSAPEPEPRRRRSPPTSSQSVRSYYSGSSEPSPALTAAPLLPVSQMVSTAPPLNYNLSIRQQPAAARACGFGERDRRVVDPPPILELKITDKATGGPEQDNGCILALHCSLLSVDGTEESEVSTPQGGSSATRRLMGTVVSSPYQAKDETGVAGTFFVFPDLSCRSPGRYKLGFKLIRVDPMNMKPGCISPCVGSITSEAFSVYTAKDFPGMRASSALLKALRRQGLNVGVKKGSDARKGKGKGKAKKVESATDEDEEDEDESDEVGEEDERREDAEERKLSSDADRAAARKKGKRRKLGGP